MSPEKNKKNMLQRAENGRLAFYKAAADEEFWDQHWAPLVKHELFAWAERGELGHFQEVFTRYLPREGRIVQLLGGNISFLSLGSQGIAVMNGRCGYQKVAQQLFDTHVFPRITIFETVTELRGILKKIGFEVIDYKISNGYKGLKDEVRLVREMLKWGAFGRWFQQKTGSLEMAG